MTVLQCRPVVRAGQRAPARCHGERETEQTERLKVDLPREKDALDQDHRLVFWVILVSTLLREGGALLSQIILLGGGSPTAPLQHIVT